MALRYIKQLTEKDITKLLNKLEFELYENKGRTGNERFTEYDYLVISSWNHDFANADDFIDEFLYIEDYNINHWKNRKKYIPIFYDFMIRTFGKQWVKDALHNLKNKKATKLTSQLLDCYEKIKDERSTKQQ